MAIIYKNTRVGEALVLDAEFDEKELAITSEIYASWHYDNSFFNAEVSLDTYSITLTPTGMVGFSAVSAEINEEANGHLFQERCAFMIQIKPKLVVVNAFEPPVGTFEPTASVEATDDVPQSEAVDFNDQEVEADREIVDQIIISNAEEEGTTVIETADASTDESDQAPEVEVITVTTDEGTTVIDNPGKSIFFDESDTPITDQSLAQTGEWENSAEAAGDFETVIDVQPGDVLVVVTDKENVTLVDGLPTFYKEDESGMTLASSDGENWVPHAAKVTADSPEAQEPCNEKLIVATSAGTTVSERLGEYTYTTAGKDGTMMTSSDGKTWEPCPSMTAATDEPEQV